MPAKTVVPTITAKSFSCPYCGALADQTWFLLYGDRTKGGEPPRIINKANVEQFRTAINETRQSEVKDAREALLPKIERLSLRQPFIYRMDKTAYLDREIANVFVSHCFSCKDISIWRYDTLLYPPSRHEVEPNQDLDPDIRTDFDEARAVFAVSPRASAALLRLCIQKLCKQLGMPGRNIDKDIGALVAKGLPETIQKALDLVRVIGNNSVHPGTINLNDDRATASKLFELVNMIAETQITQPKAIGKLFDEKVPVRAKEAIIRRDKPKS